MSESDGGECKGKQRIILGTQYASRVSEQCPIRGKISLEIIKDLYQMSTDLLKLFIQRNGCFPNKIVFYRDGRQSLFFDNIHPLHSGVDDGHFQKVLDNEIRALQNACRGKDDRD